MFAVWSWLLQVVLVSTILAADFSGPVVCVLDGDAIELLHTNRAERIHLNGIDRLALALIPVSAFDYGLTLHHHSC